MRALVTGAGGFLGRHVVAALLARGHRVRAMVRPAARLEGLGWPASPGLSVGPGGPGVEGSVGPGGPGVEGSAGPGGPGVEGVEVVRADLRAARDLAPAFEGVDVLVHLAAAVSGGEDLQFAAAVAGTERLLGAMATTPCRRLVLASSFAVYDVGAIRGGVHDESAPLHRAPELYGRDGYTIAKLWQERVTRRLAEQHGWDLTVLRPGFIWGRDHAYLSALGQRLGRHHLVIGPLTRLPLTHVENCADVFAQAAEDPRARGQTFNVVDGRGERIWTFLGDYQRGTGERGLRIPVPYRPALWAIRLAYATVFRRATKVPTVLIPNRFESRLRPLRFENRRLREVLGWKPPLDYRQCLARTYGPPRPAAVEGLAQPS
ncbi:MAG TPA: NAD(P)-dependent oxidoreductase [Anaeromyxobacteraceae bacterium]|nr:NAD(P)-dependent oxidoreductase [Anaeromyxobacteraceae bacterium]